MKLIRLNETDENEPHSYSSSENNYKNYLYYFWGWL
jgi:hypothetical protein